MTGWTYPQIADLTIPQMRCVLLQGRKASPRIAGPKQMRRILERMKRGEF